MRCEHCEKKLGKGNWVNHQCPNLPKPPLRDTWREGAETLADSLPEPVDTAADTQPARPRTRSRRSRKAPGE